VSRELGGALHPRQVRITVCSVPRSSSLFPRVIPEEEEMAEAETVHVACSEADDISLVSPLKAYRLSLLLSFN